MTTEAGEEMFFEGYLETNKTKKKELLLGLLDEEQKIRIGSKVVPMSIDFTLDVLRWMNGCFCI